MEGSTGKGTTPPPTPWSLSSKLTVGIGLFLAAALVVVLYLPH